ncbi:hypothetical protein PPL_09471 [Heterostelium album PN500]|uniref:Pentatricopeptide repeat-containing protein n=1 Tax=Heterostelium pallidum (strain ATCC 26659 / Pp 5 / PN500) TaxID=670386 RepID=D3BPK2_HETP5|nr:hypothetical protein PPL_09471 [Heterostelium album PN500]EFA76720.1 hypothetical protein PPL_09471 [Heterostelium album PN500]|eukprot:XP_020428852.1 hypothetical protein PPL_09471 [Heterostelium album PN500]
MSSAVSSLRGLSRQLLRNENSHHHRAVLPLIRQYNHNHKIYTTNQSIAIRSYSTNNSDIEKTSNPRKISFKKKSESPESPESSNNDSNELLFETSRNNNNKKSRRNNKKEEEIILNDNEYIENSNSNNNSSSSNNSNNNNLIETNNNRNKIVFQKKDSESFMVDASSIRKSNEVTLTEEEREAARLLPSTTSPLSDITKSAAYDTMMEYQKQFPILGKGKQHLYSFNTSPVPVKQYFTANELNFKNVIRYISRMGISGHPQLVLDCVDYLDKEDIVINPYIYSLILRALGIAGDVENSLKIFERLMSEGIKPTVHMFDGVINAYMNASKVDDALQILKSMEEKYSLVPDHVNYTTLIHGLVRNEKVDMAIEMFSDARTKGMDPDTVTLSVMIDACAKDDRVEKAFNYFDEFRYLNLPPTEVTFNSLISACSKRADNYYYLKAFELFQEMTLYNFQPDIITYTSLMRAAAYRGEIRVVEKLYKDILERKDLFPHKPDEHVFSLILGAYANNIRDDVNPTKFRANLKPNLERVEQIFKDAQQLMAGPITKYIIDQYLKAYAFSNKITTTEKIFNEVYAEHKVEQDIISYSIMLSLYCHTRRFEKAQKLFQDMREKGIKPDYKLYKILLFGTTKVGYANTCLKLAKEMVGFGFPPESKDMDKIVKRFAEYPEIVTQLQSLTVSSKADDSYNAKHLFYQ